MYLLFILNVQELSFSGVIQNRLSKWAFYLYESLPIALNLTTNIEVNLECDSKEDETTSQNYKLHSYTQCTCESLYYKYTKYYI